MLNTILGSFSTGVAPVTTSYESIATVTVGSGGSASAEFTSIPATYTHLQIRCISRSSVAGTGTNAHLIQFNSDTAGNYSNHTLRGNGSTVTVSAAANASNMLAWGSPSTSSTANAFGGTIIDILDYADTNKYKTLRSLGGLDVNDTGSSLIVFSSGNWRNTNAITSIKLTCANPDYSQYSSFALYGIKGVA